MKRNKNKKAVTLIEMLMCIAIISFAFEGLFHITVMMMNEGSAGALEAGVRQELSLASATVFKDIKNAKETPEKFKDFQKSADCLILKYPENDKNVDAIILRKSGDKLVRTLYFSNSDKMAENVLIKNISKLNFKTESNLVEWKAEVSYTFRRNTKTFSAGSSALIQGGFVK